MKGRRRLCYSRDCGVTIKYRRACLLGSPCFRQSRRGNRPQGRTGGRKGIRGKHQTKEGKTVGENRFSNIRRQTTPTSKGIRGGAHAGRYRKDISNGKGFGRGGKTRGREGTKKSENYHQFRGRIRSSETQSVRRLLHPKAKGGRPPISVGYYKCAREEGGEKESEGKRKALSDLPMGPGVKA